MTAFTLGEAAARALGHVRAGGGASTRAGRRSGAPVRAGSVEAGSFEDGFFAVPAPGECDRMVRLARAGLDAGRRLKRAARAEGRTLTAAERRLAAITAGAVRVFEELCQLARLNRGRVYPSYDRLADRTALGRATVARALGVLEEAGFLVRQRRFRRVEGEGPGPRWAQTSNAYRPVAPARLMELLPRWLRPAPPPADAVQREADRAEELAAMHATLSCRELARVTVGGALGRALARLGGRLDTRESHDGTEPLLQSS
jgi:DNA-binding transcriptional ArsR family regulator